MPPVLALGLACLLFVPANWPALKVYHRSEKENWRGIAAFIGENLYPDEAIYVSPQFWANPLLFYRPSVEPQVVGGDYNVNSLARAAEQHAGLWYLRHVDPIGDPKGELTGWVTAQHFDLLIDGYACGWGIHVYYRRLDEPGAGQAGRPAPPGRRVLSHRPPVSVPAKVIQRVCTWDRRHPWMVIAPGPGAARVPPRSSHLIIEQQPVSRP